MRMLLGALLLLSVCLCGPAWAQLAVYDGANHATNSVTAGQSTITAIQSTISAIEDVLQTGYMVINLTPVEGIFVADGISADMAALADIVSQAEGLPNDLSSLQSQIAALFDLDNPPTTSALLYERLREIRRVRHLGHAYALRVQTLVTTALTTVDHLVGLVNSIAAFIGNLSADQRLAEVQGTISKTLTTMQATTASYERAQTVDKMEELLIAASLEQINNRVWDR